MAAKGISISTGMLNLLLNGGPASAALYQNGTAPAATLYVSLHTASPGINGNQNTNEAAYTGYQRVAISRNSGAPAWTVGSGQAYPNASITFPPCTAGSETETYMAIGLAGPGVGASSVVIYFGPITPNIVVSAGVTPQLVGGPAESLIQET